jgi:alginate O-acetyltransferase complex protein AlgI
VLFNSYEFIFLYLPVVLVGFFCLAKISYRAAALWLAIASLFFYGWWNPKFVALLLVSIVLNFSAGALIGRAQTVGRSKGLLVVAVSANLLLLALFKYANFFIASTNAVGGQWSSLDIVLPLGISFFTFTQIAFLVDVYRGLAREVNFVHYLLFVTWFPHLIAGPVLHHKQMMPQFALPATYRPSAESMAVGLTYFALGLFKKVMLADQLGAVANPAFSAASQDAPLIFFEAWIGALAYALQLYFDFSGYSDMAVGLSRMFNVKLPFNFDSPYKAANIIDFWRRWHMTLSTFLRDYLYQPLGGNRKGPTRRYVNLMVTMLLGGLWHGAGWNFVLWGGLHGVYLCINHGWRKLTGSGDAPANPLTRVASVAITFIAVVIAWVPFRAESLHATASLWKAMAGLNGISLPSALADRFPHYTGDYVQFSGLANSVDNLNQAMILLPVGLFIVWLMPNTQQWLAAASPRSDLNAVPSQLSWRPTWQYALLIGGLLGACVLSLDGASEFLYYQF